MSSHPGATSTTLDSAGTGVLEISHSKSGFVWRIHQFAILSVPPGAMDLVSLFNDRPMMSDITVVSGAAADGEPSMDIGDHDVIKMLVTNGPPDANVVLAYYYEEVPFGG